MYETSGITYKSVRRCTT